MAFQRLILGLFLALLCGVSSFTLVMMGARRSKGNLKRALEDTGKPSSGPQAVKALNQGRGQEITGVTLPAEGKIKGWEFGGGMRVAAAQVDGQFDPSLEEPSPRAAPIPGDARRTKGLVDGSRPLEGTVEQFL